ncbi:hypothetical protein HDU92_005544 [Lobulomyces angularis]|nr:hypothetical protein HDU92_005544 [Lobulomyces angularis]
MNIHVDFFYCRIDPLFLSKVKEIYVMGGTLYSKGNSSKVAEFNFHYDPESAQVLFSAAKKHHKKFKLNKPIINLVTWEVTVHHPVSLKLLKELKKTKTLEDSRKKIFNYFLKFIEISSPPTTTNEHKENPKKNMGDEGEENLVKIAVGSKVLTERITDLKYDQSFKAGDIILPDFTAICCFLKKDVVLSYKDFDIEMELEGRSRGGNSFGWNPWHQDMKFVRVFLELDSKKIDDIFTNTFFGE